MAVQTTQLYNNGYQALIADGLAGTSEFMWILVDNDYNPEITHTTGTDLDSNHVTGDGSPVSATEVQIATISSAGYFQAGTTAGGSSIVKIGPDTVGGVVSYRYLVFARTGGATYTPATAELIFYIDLTGADSNDTLAIGEYVIVNMTNNGWFKMVQA